VVTAISKAQWNKLRRKAALLGKRKAVKMSRLPRKRREVRLVPSGS
jgi:hypothetical protein